MTTCTLKDPHDCANVRAANDALRRHLNRACEERDAWKLAHDAAALNLSLAGSERDAARAEAERLAGTMRTITVYADLPSPLSHRELRDTLEAILIEARAALAGSPQDERSETKDNQKENAP